MKKIIHLSDIHVGHEDCGDRFRVICENIASATNPPGDYVVIITGDIVDNANQSEQSEEALAVINDLKDNGFTVLVVPGNHDYGTGALGNAKFVSIFKKKFYGTSRVSYPRLDVIDNIAFIGLDSTAEELHWRDRILSEGELGKLQLGRLKRILERPELARCKKVIYLHHHPFDFKMGMQLKDNDELKKVIENKADAILFGHYHVDSSSVGETYHGTWGIPRCYNAGSSTHKNGNEGVHRVIDLFAEDPAADYDGSFLDTK